MIRRSPPDATKPPAGGLVQTGAPEHDLAGQHTPEGMVGVDDDCPGDVLAQVGRVRLTTLAACLPDDVTDDELDAVASFIETIRRWRTHRVSSALRWWIGDVANAQRGAP